MMSDRYLDIYNHCLPPAYVEACRRCLAKPLVMFDRATRVPGMSDLEERIQIMDAFPGYQQILSLSSPSPEAIASAEQSPELARIGNDAVANWCQHHRDRFPGFVATLPLNHAEAAMKEADRAVNELGALGIQVYTHVNGLPLDRPEFLQILEYMAEIDRPVWLHPLRPSSYADYPGETISKYDLWWAFGWPHETSVCAGRLVFSGIFDRCPDLKIITHHAGGTIPMMEGRLTGGLESLGSRYAPEQADAAKTDLQEKPIDAFRRFYADTATFGSRIGIDAGVAFFGANRMFFASDFPFAGIEESIEAAQGLGEDILYRNAENLLGVPVS